MSAKIRNFYQFSKVRIIKIWKLQVKSGIFEFFASSGYILCRYGLRPGGFRQKVRLWRNPATALRKLNVMNLSITDLRERDLPPCCR